MRFVFLALAVTSVGAVSPVQKVVQLLGECKAKVEADLAEEAKSMQEYTSFCDNESKDKAYAIETAGRSIADLSAVEEDSKATIATSEDEVSTLGSVIAEKESELTAAKGVRAEQHNNFVAAEKELVTSVDQLGRAASVLKKGASLAQMRGGHASFSKASQAAVAALKTIVESQWIDASSQRSLQSFLQSKAATEASEDDDLSLDQPQAKQVAYESSSGNIVQTVEEMQGKAEDTLSEARKKEMEESHAFQMVESGLASEIENNKERLATNSKNKAAAQQALSAANGEKVETQKSKATDEAYSATLKSECQARAVEYEESMKSGKEEIGAIAKATEILASGVTAFVQVSTRIRRSTSRWSPGDDDESDAVSEARSKVVDILKGLASERHSFVFAQLASMAASDPFVKIRGLINDMIAKLVQEAQEAATHEAFCQEEMSKTAKSQADKTMKLEKFSTRVDEAESTLAQLTQAIKTLEGEVAEIDKAQAAATKLRTEEHAAYAKASKDFRDSATAVAQAVEVLQNFYSGASFIQTGSKIRSKSASSDESQGQGDTANVIISVLEMAQEDFTTLLAETEAVESEAAAAYTKLETENKVAKASKLAEAKGNESQVKSLTSQLTMSKEDKASTQQELDAVLAYLDKLKPECESKAMSYEEKKAARDAEIAGLKDALDILASPGAALVQTGRHVQRITRA